MADREDSDIDDDFSELYKEYTGPPRSTSVQPETTLPAKRSHADSDEETDPLDPSAVPTGFTSRDAKFWEAKSKATEKNWKKMKEEEMICKLCGESSHYTQGCPSTLGANRKSQDLFQRVPARDPQTKALFTERVIKKIETEIGCKLRMEEKFIIVSGKDGRILSNGVDAVFKIKNEGENTKIEPNFNIERSKSPKLRSPVSSKMVRSDSQRSIPSPRITSSYNPRPAGRQEKVVDEHVREEFQKYSRGSPQARAYGNDHGGRTRSTHSKSPARTPYMTGGSSYSLNNNNLGPVRDEGRDADPRGHKGGGYSSNNFSQTFEELELEYKRDAMDIAKIRDKEEDEENHRHREAVREIRENHLKRLAMMRETHAKQWEKFLQLDARRSQQQTRQQIPASGFGGYKHEGHYDYGNAASNPYINNNMSTESRVRYPELDNYPLRSSHNNYEDFQHQRHEDHGHGKTYNRY